MADLTTRDLARRVRQNRALSGSQKRYWLAVLPHLKPEDRERLDAILRGDAPPSACGPETVDRS